MIHRERKRKIVTRRRYNQEWSDEEKNKLMIKGNESHEERERVKENRSHDLEKNKEKYV